MSKKFFAFAVIPFIAVNAFLYVLLNDVCVRLFDFATPGCPSKPAASPKIPPQSDKPYFTLLVKESSWEYLLEETGVLGKIHRTDPEVDNITIKSVARLSDPYVSTGGFSFQYQEPFPKKSIAVGRATLFKSEDDSAFTLYVFVSPEFLNAGIPQDRVNHMVSQLIIGELLQYDEIMQVSKILEKSDQIFNEFNRKFTTFPIVVSRVNNE